MELKPCPFCGSLNVFLQSDSFAKCGNCRACGHKLESSRECDFDYEHNETEELASKSWNKRH